MIKIEDVEVMGMRKAIKAMHNATNSWDKSDSKECRLGCVVTDVSLDDVKCNMMCMGNLLRGYTQIGKSDMNLARLIKKNSLDSNFMKMIHIQADIIGPLYWWEKYSEYNVGSKESCSILNTLLERELTIDDFSHEHLTEDDMYVLKSLIKIINRDRLFYLYGCKDEISNIEPFHKTYWYKMLQLLPSSYNVRKTIDLDYETLLSIYYKEKNSKLDEWQEFCKWIKGLPYMKDFLKKR